MSFITTAPVGASLRRTVAVLGTTAVASLGLTGVAAADAEPTFIAGNPTCASIGGGLQELKIDPVPQGRTTKSGFSIAVSGRVFDFTTTTPVDAVIVKGGPNALVYRYNEATSGSGLHAPVNPSNGQLYGLSHISFCYDQGTPPPPPADPCEGNPNGTKANGEPCTPVMPPQDPCEADPNGTKASGEPCTPPADPCKGNPSGTMANGEPCTPPVRTDEQPRQAVLAAVDSSAPASGRAVNAISRRVAANASMSRLRRCVTRPFTAVVRGRGIKRVTMYVNGKKVRTLAGGKSRYALRVNPAKVSSGVIRVKARVEYVAASGKRARTLSMTALRCQVRQAAPQFAG